MILLYSGGLDSYIAWHYLKKPNTIYFNLRHKYADMEIASIIATLPGTEIVEELDLSRWEEADANIPMRNAFMCMLASLRDPEVALIVQRGEMTVPDRSEQFFNSFGSWLSWMNSKGGYRIFTPFAHMTKTQMVKWYLDMKLPKENLLETRSCFSSAWEPCGECAACFRRWVAFENNGIGEEYISPILEWSQIPIYINKMRSGKYDELRTQETFDALKGAGYDL